MSHIRPVVILDGSDVSKYFVNSHSEQTGNSSKDPGKYDLTLANVGGWAMGAFAPKSIEVITEEELGNFKTAPKKKGTCLAS